VAKASAVDRGDVTGHFLWGYAETSFEELSRSGRDDVVKGLDGGAEVLVIKRDVREDGRVVLG
jgi:hypothetical protein